MTRIQIKNFVLVALFFLPFLALAQTIIGTVKDKDGKLLPYVKVIEDKATNNTTTKEDGSFSLRVSILPTKLIFKAIGYKDYSVAIANKNAISVVLEKNEVNLETTLSAGNITKSRNVIDSPVALSYISINDINATGRLNLDDVLAYSTASINATTSTNSDVSNHLSTTDMKGLGASRMLILVNGKRKNLSAITNITNSYGKGEVGADLKSIPVAAIDHIEVLREGASAIYGSDAMAGVINIVLKKKTDMILANYNVGISSKGDGMLAGGDVNGTFTNKNGDYVNYTIGVNYQDYTNRAGEPGEDVLAGMSSTNPWIKDNPDLGMTIGQSRMLTGNVYFNAAKPFKNGKGEFYATVGGEVRNNKSFLLAQAPYFGTDPSNLYNGQGYTPELKTSIMDNMDVLGIKYNTNGFNIDVSGTFGVNDVDIFVDESLNISMGNDSPKSFDNGGYRFSNIIGNLDVKKSFDKLNVAFGAEYKVDAFKEKQGELDSWFDSGSVGFIGIKHGNKISKDRNSFGAFLGLDFDVNEDFLIGAGARYDNYSDVGDQVTYKANARYKFGNKGAVRASYGTNFRAPALQQMYTNYTNTSGQSVLNNTSRAALGFNDLEAETSTNMNVGVFFNPMKNLTLSLDYYTIAIKNRVFLSSAILDSSYFGPDRLAFTNGLDTDTKGIDFAAKYDNIRFPSGVLAFTLAANWNDTSITSDEVTYFNRTEQGRITNGRPNIKGSLGINYAQDVFSVSLNNTYFGDVTWQHATDQNKDQTFKSKFLTDILVNYKLTDVINLNLALNNILNVYPDKIDSTDISRTLGGRYEYPYQVSQIGVLGMNVKAGVSLKF